MDFVTLPRTNLKVSRICLGCWQMNGNNANINWDAQPYETSKACVDKCLELGINFFDTAEGYAGSEEILGRCLLGRRQDAIIATKFGFRDGIGTPAYSAVQIDEAITKSLRKLQTDYIDLLQAHFPSFISNTEEAITELKRQVSLGRIRSWGVCNFGPKNLKSLIDMGEIPVSNQIGYNLLWRSPEREVIPICKDKDIAVLAYSPLQQGLLSGNYMTLQDVPEGRRRGKLFAPTSTEKSRHGQPGCEPEMFEALHAMKDLCTKADVPMAKAALSWILQQEIRPVVIVGCSSPEQVVDNYNVMKITDELMHQLSLVTEKVKEKLGTTMDQWMHPDRCE
ncbi:1-deoxyxylulose-5-phosphate synthase YajO-like [Dreissena polymorpha]|uniref:1-deoxyxylulose-5-phosphate synthase YajO-like n=1 Tax=Dreissena polymorpha TaxID=45954 RepID=UPI00226523D4|nr:1-deoxyxylulose-5-phosphate synthase YajO-like [Dreissena polymorpha]